MPTPDPQDPVVQLRTTSANLRATRGWGPKAWMRNSLAGLIIALANLIADLRARNAERAANAAAAIALAKLIAGVQAKQRELAAADAIAAAVIARRTCPPAVKAFAPFAAGTPWWQPYLPWSNAAASPARQLPASCTPHCPADRSGPRHGHTHHHAPRPVAPRPVAPGPVAPRPRAHPPPREKSTLASPACACPFRYDIVT